MRVLLLIVAINNISGCANSYKGPVAEIVQRFEVAPNQILLVVKSKSAVYTDLFPYECDPEKCIPFYFWFVYDAEVLDVLSGNYTDKEVVFVNLQHAYFTKEVTNEWYVLIERFANSDTIRSLNSQYYVVQHESPFFEEE